MLTQGIQGVLRTGGGETTRGGKIWRDTILIELNEPQKGPYRQVLKKFS